MLPPTLARGWASGMGLKPIAWTQAVAAQRREHMTENEKRQAVLCADLAKELLDEMADIVASYPILEAIAEEQVRSVRQKILAIGVTARALADK